MSVCTPTAMASEAQRARAISSQSTAVVSTSAPAPPYFSSYSTPRKPSAPMRGQIDLGICPASSHASTWGSTSFWTKARTACRNISWCSSKIFTSSYPTSLDDLVRPREHRLWNHQAEDTGRPHVDDQLELGGLLHRQISRLRALEDTVDVDRGLAPHDRGARPVEHQAAGGHVHPVPVHGHEAALGGEAHDDRAIRRQHRVRRRHEGVRPAATHGSERGLEAGPIV